MTPMTTDSMRNCIMMFWKVRAQRFTDADFPRPFSDGDHHDIHDTDAADDERNGGDTAQEEGQHGRRAGHGFHEARQVADVEVVFLAVHDVMALAQQRFDFGLDLFDFIGAGDWMLMERT